MNAAEISFIYVLCFLSFYIQFTVCAKRNWILFDYSNSNDGNDQFIEHELKSNAIVDTIGEESGEEFIGQVPLDYVPPQVQKNITESCRFNQECFSGCCLYNRGTLKRTCEPMSKTGEKCSVGQIKTNHYADFCPCESGDDACPHPSYICI